MDPAARRADEAIQVAIRALGGAEKLCGYLKITPAELLDWACGKTRPSEKQLLMMVEACFSAVVDAGASPRSTLLH